MIDAAMGGGITRFGGANLHAAMGADVEHDMHVAITRPRHDHIILGHVAHDIVACLGDFRLMAQQQPGARKDALHLQIVEFLVVHHAQRHLIHVAVDEVVERGAIAQRQPGLVQHLPLPGKSIVSRVIHIELNLFKL